MPSIDWFAIAPEIALFGAALVIVLLRSLVRHDPRVHAVVAAHGDRRRRHRRRCSPLVQWRFVQDNGPYQTMITNTKPVVGMIAVDGFAVFAKTVVLIATLLALLLSSSYLKREQLEGPEYFALMLCSATGMMLMTSANDLVTIFLSLEILSIALYVLAAFDRRRVTSQEVGPQVLHAGLVLVRGVPLRRRARLRRHRHHQPHRDRRSSWPTTTLLHDGVLLLGHRVPDRRASGSRSRRRRSTCGPPTCTRARPRR